MGVVQHETAEDRLNQSVLCWERILRPVESASGIRQGYMNRRVRTRMPWWCGRAKVVRPSPIPIFPLKKKTNSGLLCSLSYIPNFRSGYAAIVVKGESYESQGRNSLCSGAKIRHPGS